MKKVLITGTNGLLGQKLIYKLLSEKKFDIIATSRGENRLLLREGYTYSPLEITSREDVKNVFSKYRPDYIINTAAMTNVDQCEKEKEECRKANVDSVLYMVEALAKLKGDNYDPFFLHLSTDFIFDGENGPYTEDDEPNPISFYGQSKLDSEDIVIASSLRWAIARTIIVYGIVDNMSRSNIVLWAKDALSKGQTINVVDDQFRSPTLAEDLADGCMLIVEKEAEGIWNISGKETMSILDLVKKVADYYYLDKSLINPIKSSTLNQPAKRPPRTGFILDKAINELGYNPHSFEEGIKILDEQMSLKA